MVAWSPLSWPLICGSVQAEFKLRDASAARGEPCRMNPSMNRNVLLAALVAGLGIAPMLRAGAGSAASTANTTVGDLANEGEGQKGQLGYGNVLVADSHVACRQAEPTPDFQRRPDWSFIYDD